MSTLPIIIAIAAAAVVVVLVLVAVLVSRRRKAGAADDEPAGSFLGSRPQDTFAGLGKPETSPEPADDEFRLDWGHTGDDLAAAAVAPAPPDEGTTPDEDEPAGPDEEEPASEDQPAGPDEGTTPDEDEPAGPDEDEPAGEGQPPGPDEDEPVDAAGDEAAAGAADEAVGAVEQDAAATAAGEAAVAAEHDADAEIATESATAEHPATADTEAAPKPPEEAPGGPPEEPRARRMVPLSDIIVTTSRKMVDLDDPEVRRMLTELVRYEIDQASEFSAAGQTVDAILQLTEAEKVSRTLGMDETAARIKTMMRELRD